MTGSLSVRGEVLPIGGVTAKVEAGIEAGINTVIIPKTNLNDLVLSEENKKLIEIIAVDNLYDVLKIVLSDCSMKTRILKKIIPLKKAK